MACIGVVCNFYNEANALPGFLETHTAFFDHLSFYQAGPNGADSTDGSLDILAKWKMPIHRGSINDGFGAVRTAAIRSSPCEWVMILDADERFYRFNQVMNCGGESTPPDEVSQILAQYDDRNQTAVPSNFENVHKLGANLRVTFGEVYDQGAWLRSILDSGQWDAISTIRRHWHDFTCKRPTQNWHTEPDYQMRLVRNTDSIYFTQDTRMHERLTGAASVYRPNHTHGPFFDHFHMCFKPMEGDQRRHDVAIYDAIHEGRVPPTLDEFKSGKR